MLRSIQSSALKKTASPATNKRGLTLSLGKANRNRNSLSNQENISSHITIASSPRLSRLFEKQEGQVVKNRIRFVEGYQSKSSSSTAKCQLRSKSSKQNSQNITLGGIKKQTKPTAHSLSFYLQNRHQNLPSTVYKKVNNKISLPLQNFTENQICDRRFLRESTINQAQKANLNYFEGAQFNFDNFPIVISKQLSKEYVPPPEAKINEEKQCSEKDISMKQDLISDPRASQSEGSQMVIQQERQQESLKLQRAEIAVETEDNFSQLRASSISKLAEVQSRLDSLLSRANQARHKIHPS